MNFKTASQCAKEWNISQRRVQILCAEGRVDGAFKIGGFWAIPAETNKPISKREKKNEKTKI
ncbi:MAG: DNA-binding protein [Alphaproteobacteria bacterium]|nr:DNA-binding protein [Alphaproteobacteria bacterium]